MRFQLIINRGLDGKFEKVTKALEDYGQVYAQKMAEQLVLASPVDTGAFMDGFYAGSSGGFTTSRGRPRNQPWQPYADAALSRMVSGIAFLYGSTAMTFGNAAEHASKVEYDHGYAPFGKAANMHGQLAREAWAEVGL